MKVGWNFVDNIFKYIFLNEYIWITSKISLKGGRKGSFKSHLFW